MTSRLRALRVVHPFPSLLNTALVLGLAAVAGASTMAAALLAVGMLGIQFCIGTVNDLCDVEADQRSKAWKPIASGLLPRAAARSIAVVAAAVALIATLPLGITVVAMAVAMLACGLAYDLRLKRTAWAWACFSVAFAILPVYAWYGSIGTLPPLSELLLPLAILAGPALQLSNGLVDLEGDEASGIATLATRLGRRRTMAAIGLLLAVIYGLAWLTLSISSGRFSPAVATASAAALIGLFLLARQSARTRELGWSLEAGGIALLGLGWLSAVA